MRNYFLLILLMIGCIGLDVSAQSKSQQRKAKTTQTKQKAKSTAKKETATAPTPKAEPKETFDYSEILALQIPTVNYILQAKKDPATKKYGYENVGEKQYWWAEAHKLGKKKEELNADHQTQWVISPQYDKVSKNFSEGLAAVEINGKIGFIDQFNRFILPPQFEPAEETMEGFYLGLAPVKKDGKFGFINKKGEFLIKPEYEKAERFGDDMLAIVKSNNKFGCIDLNGDTVVPCAYIAKEIMTTVPIKNKPYKAAQKTAMENLAAGGYAAMVAKIFSSEDYASSQLENLALMPVSGLTPTVHKGEIKSLSDGFYLWANDDKTGIIDSYGRQILQPNYKNVSYQPNEKIFIVEEIAHGDGKPAVGILNRAGGWIIPPVFESLSSFKKGKAQGTIGEFSTQVDTHGLVESSFIDNLLKASSQEQDTYYTQRLIEIWPTCAPAHNNMGIFYASSRNDLKHAINHFTVAHRLEPDNEEFKTNMKSAKSERNNRRWNRVLTGLQIAGAVLTIGAMTYSAVSGNTVMSSSDFSGSGLSSFGDAGSLSASGSYGSAGSASGSSGSKSGLSEATYRDMYQRWERNAKSCYESLTVVGTRVQKNGKDSSGSANGTWGAGSFTGMKQNLRTAQREMKKLRREAQRNGITIPASEYETINVSY